MKTKQITITLCPECREYLAKTNKYKYCMYCGWKYNSNKLVKEKIEVNNDFIDGSIYKERR